MNSLSNCELKAYGLTNLHLAVIHGQTRRVQKLLATGDKKDIIDARDAEGTTPLMAAVLTGRLAITRLLLRNGASSEVKDRRGRKALKYSRASLMKKILHIYERLGLPLVSEKQISKRKSIAKILRYPAALESCRQAGKHECSRAIFYKNSTELNVLKPDITFKISKENLEKATSGFIASATRPEVKTAAASGWQPNPARGRDVLDNAKYVKLVQDLATVLSFELVRSQRDNNGQHLPEHAGRFVACHTEKKLAVFWVVAALKGILGTTDLRRVHELREAAIPATWKEAWVFLDHTPCGNCWEFLQAIKQATGLRIHLETRPFLAKGNREATSGCHKCPCHRCRQKFEIQPAPDRQINSKERDKAGEDDGPEAESRSSDEDAADFQPTMSEPPKRWRRFHSKLTGKVYAKPIRRPPRVLIGARLNSSSPLHGGSRSKAPSNQQSGQARVVAQPVESRSSPASKFHTIRVSSQNPRDSAATELRDPPSMIAGRSGFFTTPEPRLTIEVRIPEMHPKLQAEYDRVSDISGARSPCQRSRTPRSVPIQSPAKRTRQNKQHQTIRQAAAALDLKRFAYNASGSSDASAASKTTSREREKKRAAASGKVTKTKKPRARVGREDRLRAKSAFAKAVEHHQRKRAGKA